MILYFGFVSFDSGAEDCVKIEISQFETIWVESVIGHDCNFCFTSPIAPTKGPTT